VLAKSDIATIVYQNGRVETFESENQSTPASDVSTPSNTSSDYALVHIYRTNSLVGSGINYDVHLGDEVICHAKNGWKTTVQVHNFGPNTLWSKTESKITLPVDIEPGGEYYIKCSVKVGIVVGRPSLKLMDESQGKAEFDSIK
jgi:hypothetical protein